jgi:hypothetical protein
VINAQEIFLEDAGYIHLECHQNYRPFLISRIVFLFDVTGLEINRGVFIDGRQQGFDLSLHVLSVVMCSELVF